MTLHCPELYCQIRIPGITNPLMNRVLWQWLPQQRTSLAYGKIKLMTLAIVPFPSPICHLIFVALLQVPWLNTLHSKNQHHGIRSHHFIANRWGNNGNSGRLFSWAPKSLQRVTAALELKDACSLEEYYGQPRQYMKKQRYYFDNKGSSSQGYGFSSSHVWM